MPCSKAELPSFADGLSVPVRGLSLQRVCLSVCGILGSGQKERGSLSVCEPSVHPRGSDSGGGTERGGCLPPCPAAHSRMPLTLCSASLPGWRRSTQSPTGKRREASAGGRPGAGALPADLCRKAPPYSPAKRSCLIPGPRDLFTRQRRVTNSRASTYLAGNRHQSQQQEAPPGLLWLGSFLQGLKSCGSTERSLP